VNACLSISQVLLAKCLFEANYVRTKVVEKPFTYAFYANAFCFASIAVSEKNK